MRPTLILTRPAEQSQKLAKALAHEGRVLIAPVLEICGTGAQAELSAYQGVILTSVQGVAHAPKLAGVLAYCVGARTAEAARGAGACVELVAQDAEGLVGAIKAEGPLVHLCGKYRRGDIAKRLSSAGIETDEVVIYEQVPQPLIGEAIRLIEGNEPVVLPLFSPRSAMLVGEALRHVGPQTDVIAMSPAVAEAWSRATGDAADVVEAPTSGAMRARIVAALRG